MNSIKSPVSNSTGFYYYWGLKDLVITILKCHSSCGRCSGPSSTECLTCASATKEVING